MNPEMDYWQAFGLEAPAEGVQETDPAELSDAAAGENEPEVAETDEDVEGVEMQDDDTQADEDIDDGAEAASTETEPNAETQPQSKEERARQAAARRKREQDAAVKTAVDAALAAERAANDQRIRELLQGMGLKDPNNGNKPVETMDDFRQYQAAQAMRQAEADLKKGKLTPETLQQIVSQMPEVQQVQQMHQQAQREKQIAEQQRVQQQVASDIAEIAKLDPTITDLEALIKSENGQKIYELYKQGNSLVDAYKVANLDKLMQRAAAAASAQKAASDKSRQHLKITQARGQGAIDVPESQMAMYRQLMPGATPAEIRKHYGAYMRRVK